MRKYLEIFIAILALTLFANDSLADNYQTLPIDVAISIERHAETIRGSEYSNCRDIQQVDLDNNGEQDFIVFYDIEGSYYDYTEPPGSSGIVHSSWLTIFYSEGGAYRQIPPLEAGGRGIRSIVAFKVVKNSIEASTLEYGATDPRCCPSKKGKTSFVVSGGQIKEEKPNDYLLASLVSAMFLGPLYWRPRQKRKHNMPRNEISQKYQRKKCYKCRKMVVLSVKTCPNCNCNSFVFCG